MSEAGELAVGPARPGELAPVVDLHLANLRCPHSVLACLGRSVVFAANRAFASDARAALIVARDGETVVGFTSIVEGSYLRLLARRFPGRLVLGVLTHPGVLMRRELRERLGRRSDASAGADGDRGRWAQVAFTVVAPEARGRGVALRLKLAGIDAARAWGVRGLVTGVRRDNAASRRMNERAGFVEDEAAGSPSTSVYRYTFPPASDAPESVR